MIVAANEIADTVGRETPEERILDAGVLAGIRTEQNIGKGVPYQGLVGENECVSSGGPSGKDPR